MQENIIKSEEEFNITLFTDNLQIENINTKGVIHLNFNKSIDHLTLDDIEFICGGLLDNIALKEAIYYTIVKKFSRFQLNEFVVLHDGSVLVNEEYNCNGNVWTVLLNTKEYLSDGDITNKMKLKETINKWGEYKLSDIDIEKFYDAMKVGYNRFKLDAIPNKGICKLRGLDCNGRWIENSVGKMNIVTFDSDNRANINYLANKWCNEASKHLDGLPQYFRNGIVAVQLQLIDMEDKILGIITYERQITGSLEIGAEIYKVITNIKEYSNTESMNIF